MITYKEVIQQMLDDDSQPEDTVGLKIIMAMDDEDDDDTFEVDIIDKDKTRSGQLILHATVPDDLIAKIQALKNPTE